LTRDGIKGNLDPKFADGPQVHGEEIEKKRSISSGVDGEEFPAHLLTEGPVDGDQIGGLAATPGTIVNDLAMNFIGSKAYNRHKISLSEKQRNEWSMTLPIVSSGVPDNLVNRPATMPP